MTKKESGYKVIVSESVVDYIGQRTDYANIGKKYGFTARWNLKDVPFLVQDGLSEEQAESLKLETRFTQIIKERQLLYFHFQL